MKRYLFLLAILAACTVAGPAHAVGDADARQAVTLLREGLALADQAAVDGDRNKYELACLKFRESYALSPRAKPLFNLALAEKKIGRLPDAVHHLRQYVRAPDADATAVAKAEKMIRELQPKVASLRVEAPSGALLFIDGASIDDKPPLVDPLDVQPGIHTVEMRLGDRNASQSINAVAGTTSRVALQFVAPSPPAEPAPAPVAPAPSPVPTLATMPPPAASDTVSSSSTARTVTAIALGTAAVAGLGVGIGFSAAASHANDQQTSFAHDNATFACSAGATSPACGRWNDAYQSRLTDTNIATAGFVAAGISAVGCAATLLFWPTSGAPSPYAWWITPHVGAAGAGASVAGTF